MNPRPRGLPPSEPEDYFRGDVAESVRPRTHCPFCGAPNAVLAGTLHRECRSCGNVDWRNPAPAIGCAIRRGDELLLSLRGKEPKKGQWDLVGGFMDAGETPEQTFHREVQEETGCTLRDLRIVKTVPGDYDGVPTLNFLGTGRIEGEPQAADDSADLRWFPLGAVPAIAWSHEAEFVRSLRGT